MNMIFMLTLRNLLSNKKRTLLTLLTILLSISMITAILCGGWSLVDFLKEKEKVYGGDYDYYMEDLTWEQVQELYSQNNVGRSFASPLCRKQFLRGEIQQYNALRWRD